MKILLTGPPKSGKSTLLNELLNSFDNKRGMVAGEVLEDGKRVSFNLVDSDGTIEELASIKPTYEHTVGRYSVNVGAVDRFSIHLTSHSPEALLYIDEIGQMQLLSKAFHRLTASYLNASNDVIGTISKIYENDFTRGIRQRTDIVFFELTTENRHAVARAAKAAVATMYTFNRLNPTQQAAVADMAKAYNNSEKYISLRKLFANALGYAADGKVVEDGRGYTVRGDHGEYQVRSKGRNYTCECDLFRGSGAYVGNAQECSHIQATRLVRLAKA